MSDTPQDFLLGIRCTCGSTDTWLVWRDSYVSNGPFSLAGVQLKFSMKKVSHPWVICNGCGHESKGELV